MVVGSSLHLDDEMVPRIADRIARYPGGVPLLPRVIPDVPFMTAGDPALMAPDERLAADELIDIELEGLRDTQIGTIEINLVGEVVDIRNDRAIRIRQPLRRKVSNQVIVPEHIGIDSLSANIHTR